MGDVQVQAVDPGGNSAGRSATASTSRSRSVGAGRSRGAAPAFAGGHSQDDSPDDSRDDGHDDSGRDDGHDPRQPHSTTVSMVAGVVTTGDRHDRRDQREQHSEQLQPGAWSPERQSGRGASAGPTGSPGPPVASPPRVPVTRGGSLMSTVPRLRDWGSGSFTDDGEEGGGQ